VKLARLVPPAALTASALVLWLPGALGFNLLGHALAPPQRDFRIFNNFVDPTANDNQAPDAAFPGATGAVLAIWKGCVEWSSTLHGDGSGDPHQPYGLGSGGANFDPSFQGEASGPGMIGDNIHSALAGSSPGIVAFWEGGGSGWRIRYYEDHDWEDGPDANIGALYDLQGVACHEYGHALGLDHSGLFTATMYAVTTLADVTKRSLSSDDVNGVQANYGAADPSKPIVMGVTLSGANVTITGSNFDTTGNEVWFTRTSFTGNGEPLKVTDVPSNGGLITLVIPGNAASGDVLVKRTSMNGGKSLSNPWPLAVPNPCRTPASYCTTTPNSVGSGALISATTTQVIAYGDLVLHVTGAPQGQFGVFFYGQNQTNVLVGDGTLCVGAPFYRLGIVQIGTLGGAQQAVDYASPNQPGGQITPGSTWNFQFWYRDPAGGPVGNNFSDAISIRFCN
jgi:hypothetical protein